MKSRIWMGMMAAGALMLSPSYATATTRSDGITACARAMAAEMAPEQGAPVNFRIDADSDLSERRMTAPGWIYLDAFTGESGPVRARYDCRVDRHARVLRLIERPLHAPEADMRAIGQQ